QRQELFNGWQVAGTLLFSFYTSLVHFFLPLGVFHYSTLDYQTFALTVETAVIFSVTAEIILQTGFWTKFNTASLFLSLALYFVSTLILHSPGLHAAAPTDYYFPGASLNAFGNPLLWLTALVTAGTAILPSLTARAITLVLNPSDTHRVHSSGLTTLPRGPLEMQSCFQRGDPQRRSSYAMSQGQGFGRLITSGVGLHNTAPPQDRRESDLDAPHKTDTSAPMTSQ
ncbi:hypothetical protein AAFF_G00005700, partial [Aldrovandia affinis]